MKLCALLALSAAAALAQVPAHSVVNGATVDIADTVLTVPYGAPETRALISVCAPDKGAAITLTVLSTEQGGTVVLYSMVYASIKADAGYCNAALVPIPFAQISAITVDLTRSARIIPPVIVGSTAANSSALVRR